MAIDAAEITGERWCPSCRAVRIARLPAADHWACCPACGSLLIDPAVRRQFAGFWQRFAGYVIDYIVIFTIEVAIILGGTWWIADDATALFMGLLIVGIVDFLYKWIGNARGATIGKLAVGVRVVDISGHVPGFKRSLRRYFMSLLSGIGVAFGYLAMLGHRDRQTWHDSVAGTYVVVKR